jgi:hypothetical protein
MSDFPKGVAAPKGAQNLVGVCKGTWAVIEDKESELDVHNRAVESYTAAVEELNEMGVYVNNAGEFPVFTLGVKETAYDPSSRVARAPFLDLNETAELSTLTIDQRGWRVGLPQVTQVQFSRSTQDERRIW